MEDTTIPYSSPQSLHSTRAHCSLLLECASATDWRPPGRDGELRARVFPGWPEISIFFEITEVIWPHQWWNWANLWFLSRTFRKREALISISFSSKRSLLRSVKGNAHLMFPADISTLLRNQWLSVALLGHVCNRVREWLALSSQFDSFHEISAREWGWLQARIF